MEMNEIMAIISELIGQVNKLSNKSMQLWDAITDEPEIKGSCKRECKKQIERIENTIRALNDMIEGV